MKRLIASVIVVVAFTLYAIFSRSSTTQTVASVDTGGSGSASGTTTTLPVATGESDDDESLPQTGATTATPQASPVASPTAPSGYADGTYTGDQANALYGAVQVQVVIQGGKIADVQVLSHPTGRHSDDINARAVPILTQEAISSQSANVQVVSGATLTSDAFMQSLQSALAQA
jgi:uncharacterized protein with FMN-binding domain